MNVQQVNPPPVDKLEDYIPKELREKVVSARSTYYRLEGEYQGFVTAIKNGIFGKHRTPPYYNSIETEAQINAFSELHKTQSDIASGLVQASRALIEAEAEYQAFEEKFYAEQDAIREAKAAKSATVSDSN